LCNVTPGGERANPWVLNLRAQPPGPGPARRPGPNLPGPAGHPAEVERYWPQLLRVWPACERFYREGGRRSVFVLDPTTAVEPQPAEPITP
jgi:F420H(2)-dependent quinone reductase